MKLTGLGNSNPGTVAGAWMSVACVTWDCNRDYPSALLSLPPTGLQPLPPDRRTGPLTNSRRVVVPP
jgi:hypothetical protein